MIKRRLRSLMPSPTRLRGFLMVVLAEPMAAVLKKSSRLNFQVASSSLWILLSVAFVMFLVLT